ncbi:MAG: carbohydrate kinase [Clostridia bacterium]|nr:carbohydrate kinase [Clostridia bacterium]
MYDLTALGEMLIDFTAQGVNTEGQALFARNPGGAPANVAASAAKLGLRTAFIGKAGDDMHGRFLKQTLADCGVDGSGFILTKDYFTTLAFVDVRPGGEREFSFARVHGADKMLSPGELPEDILRNTKILHVGSVSLTDEPARSATLEAVRIAKESGAVITYDPNYRAPLWKSEEEAVFQMRSPIPYTDVMKLSDEETVLLTGEADPEKAADALIAQGVQLVCVTLGERGAFVRTGEGGAYVPAYPCRAIDATGAGDAFFGAFLYRLIESGKRPQEVPLGDAREFAAFANAAASLCCEKYGAIPALPTPEDVLERF